MRKASFPPHAPASTRVLILGSLPGEVSLAERRYYAHPSNQFWRLVGGVMERDVAALPYDERLAVLLESGIGLWDSIGTARRSGSLDTAIRAVEPNLLADLAAALPRLAAVGFNGGTSARIGRRQLAGRTAATLLDLPSSSAAYCRISLAEKQERWNALRAFLV